MGSTRLYRKEIREEASPNGAVYSDGFQGSRYVQWYDIHDRPSTHSYLYPQGYICNVCKTPYDSDRISCQKCGARGSIYD